MIHKHKNLEFVLGTANLGFKYGIADHEKFNPVNSAEIISYAISRGINAFDTAPDYGQAEELLGKNPLIDTTLEIYSKIPKMQEYTLENVLSSCESSMLKLNRTQITGFMFHDPDAHAHPGLNDISQEIIGRGYAKKVGFSAYSEEDLLVGKEKNPCWSIFQISENIANRRRQFSSNLQYLADSGNYIFIRSIFLQGLLLNSQIANASKFSEIRDFGLKLAVLAKRENIEVKDICLSYARRVSWAKSTVIAAADKEQLRSNLEYIDTDIDFEKLPNLDPVVIDPRNW